MSLSATGGGLPRVGRRGALVLLGGCLTGCIDTPLPPARLGINAWVGYDPLVLARDRRLFDGGALQVVELATGAETQRHLRNNLLDAGALTFDEVLRMRDNGLDLRIVALLDTSRGGDVVMAAPRIRQLGDLLGQAIAVEDSSVGTLMLHRLLEAAGLAPGDVRQVNIEATLHLQALKAGQVAAAVSYQPLAGPMAAAGFRPVFDSREIPVRCWTCWRCGTTCCSPGRRRWTPCCRPGSAAWPCSCSIRQGRPNPSAWAPISVWPSTAPS